MLIGRRHTHNTLKIRPLYYEFIIYIIISINYYKFIIKTMEINFSTNSKN